MEQLTKPEPSWLIKWQRRTASHRRWHFFNRATLTSWGGGLLIGNVINLMFGVPVSAPAWIVSSSFFLWGLGVILMAAWAKRLDQRQQADFERLVKERTQRQHDEAYLVHKLESAHAPDGNQRVTLIFSRYDQYSGELPMAPRSFEANQMRWVEGTNDQPAVSFPEATYEPAGQDAYTLDYGRRAVIMSRVNDLHLPLLVDDGPALAPPTPHLALDDL